MSDIRVAHGVKGDKETAKRKRRLGGKCGFFDKTVKFGRQLLNN